MCLNIVWLPMGNIFSSCQSMCNHKIQFPEKLEHCYNAKSTSKKCDLDNFKQFTRLAVFVISLKIFDKDRLCAQFINTRKFIIQTFKWRNKSEFCCGYKKTSLFFEVENSDISTWTVFCFNVRVRLPDAFKTIIISCYIH